MSSETAKTYGSFPPYRYDDEKAVLKPDVLDNPISSHNGNVGRIPSIATIIGHAPRIAIWAVVVITSLCADIAWTILFMKELSYDIYGPLFGGFAIPLFAAFGQPLIGLLAAEFMLGTLRRRTWGRLFAMYALFATILFVLYMGLWALAAAWWFTLLGECAVGLALFLAFLHITT